MSWVSSNDPGEAGDTVVAVAPLHTAQNLAQQASIGVRKIMCDGTDGTPKCRCRGSLVRARRSGVDRRMERVMILPLDFIS
jgi:hypothetical protein